LRSTFSDDFQLKASTSNQVSFNKKRFIEFFSVYSNLLKLLDSFKKSTEILDQVGSMTSYKLSLGQYSSIKTASMELNFKRSKAQDLNSNVALSQGQILIPNLCVALRLKAPSCDTLVLTTQVSFFLSKLNIFC